MPEHLTVVVYDAASPDAMIKFAAEPQVMEWLSYQTAENRPVRTIQEALKLIK